MEYLLIGLILLFLVARVVIAKVADGEDMTQSEE